MRQTVTPGAMTADEVQRVLDTAVGVGWGRVRGDKAKEAAGRRAKEASHRTPGGHQTPLGQSAEKGKPCRGWAEKSLILKLYNMLQDLGSGRGEEVSGGSVKKHMGSQFGCNRGFGLLAMCDGDRLLLHRETEVSECMRRIVEACLPRIHTCMVKSRP